MAAARVKGCIVEVRTNRLMPREHPFGFANKELNCVSVSNAEL